MTRDSQKSRVYSAEYRLFPSACHVLLTADEAVKLIRQASRKFYTFQPGLRWRGRVIGGGYYHQSPMRITIRGPETRGATAETVLHEYAHHLCYASYRPYGIAVHGPEFVRCLVEVMKWAGYLEKRFSMGRAKIRIAPAGPFWAACHERRDRRAASHKVQGEKSHYTSGGRFR